MSKKKEEQKHQEERFENVEHALTRSEEFIEKYQRQLTYGVLAIVVVVGIVMGYKRFYLMPKEKEAESQMFPGERYFQTDSFRLAINGDGNFLGFKYIIDEYSGTKSANLACYYTGISYLHLGQYQDALDYLDRFDADDEMISPVALGAKGDCYMELGDYDKAVKNFLAAADYKNQFTTPIHLKKAGIAYEYAGKPDKALEMYDQVKDQYGSSSEARDIDKYIERLKVKSEE